MVMLQESLRAYFDRETAGISARCTRCGKCVEVCPPCAYAGVDPAAGAAIVGGVLDFLGGAPLPAASAAWAQACNGCGECIPACPEGINPRKMLILTNARRAGAEHLHPALFKKMSRAIKILVGMQLLPAEFDRLLGKPRKETAQIVFYVGCNPLRTSHLLFNTMEVLDALEVDYEVVGGPAACCGVIHARWMGEVERGGHVADVAFAKFGKLSPEKLVSWCPSCQIHLTETLAGFRETPFDLDHITTFLVERLDDLKSRFVKPVEKRVVLHAHLGLTEFGQNVARLLQAIPGLTLVDTLFEPGFTCGGVGCDRCPPLKEAEHGKLLARVEAERADVLVTLYHSCHAAFLTAEKGKSFSVQNFTELLVEALGRQPHDDVLKRYRLADDLKLVVEEGEALLRLNGIDPPPGFLEKILPELLTQAEFRGGLECFA